MQQSDPTCTPIANILCLLPEKRWHLDELDTALAVRGGSLWVRYCDPCLDTASTLLAEFLDREITAVLYCETLDDFSNFGQSDNVTTFLQTLRDAGFPTVRERFRLGGPFDDEAIVTTPLDKLLTSLMPKDRA